MDLTITKNFDITKLGDLFLYNQKNPLLFNSAFFLFLFAGFLSIYVFLQKKVNLRIIFIVLFSLYFYYKSSGWYVILMLYTTIVGHYLTLYIDDCYPGLKKKAVLIFSLFLYLGVLFYFKYTNFFISIYNGVSGSTVEPLELFLPLGISFYTFELISYTVDVYQEKIKPVERLWDFCFYISFFPHLVAGPIVRPAELIPQIRSKISLTREDLGKGTFLIITGLLKKAVISDFISSNFVDRVFDNPSLFSGVENLFAVYGYALQIYCDFSGYSDMAIGIALLIGYKLPVNFRSPYKATSITDFWRRWHISLSSWLKDYLYIPLGGNRKGKFRQYINLFITMLLGGLWHGASWKFIFWGAMHGTGLAVEKMMQSIIKVRSTAILKLLTGILTFHFICFCWIFFRASSFSSGIMVLEQIGSSLNPELFLPVLTGYKNVFAFCLLGFLLHFIPTIYKEKAEWLVVRLPLFGKSFLLALVIWIVIQVKSADIQPFIYFQF